MTKHRKVMAFAVPIVLIMLVLSVYFAGDRIFSASNAAFSYNVNNHEYDILIRLGMCSYWGYTIEGIELKIDDKPVTPHDTLIHHYTPERMQSPTYPLFPDRNEGVEAVGYANAWLSTGDDQWIGLRVSGVHDIEESDSVELKVFYRFFGLHKQQILAVR